MNHMLLRALSLLSLWVALCSSCPLRLAYAIYRQGDPASRTIDSTRDNTGQALIRIVAGHEHHYRGNQLQLTLELSNPTTDTLFVRPDCVQIIGGPLHFNESRPPGASRASFVLPPGDSFLLIKTYTNGQHCSFKKFSKLLATQPTVFTLDGFKLGAKALTFDTLQLSPAGKQ